LTTTWRLQGCRNQASTEVAAAEKPADNKISKTIILEVESSDTIDELKSKSHDKEGEWVVEFGQYWKGGTRGRGSWEGCFLILSTF
jgi:hypothetical protein